MYKSRKKRQKPMIFSSDFIIHKALPHINKQTVKKQKKSKNKLNSYHTFVYINIQLLIALNNQLIYNVI
jgi:hypothetical protein